MQRSLRKLQLAIKDKHAKRKQTQEEQQRKLKQQQLLAELQAYQHSTAASVLIRACRSFLAVKQLHHLQQQKRQQQSLLIQQTKQREAAAMISRWFYACKTLQLLRQQKKKQQEQEEQKKQQEEQKMLLIQKAVLLIQWRWRQHRDFRQNKRQWQPFTDASSELKRRSCNEACRDAPEDSASIYEAAHVTEDDCTAMLREKASYCSKRPVRRTALAKSMNSAPPLPVSTPNTLSEAAFKKLTQTNTQANQGYRRIRIKRIPVCMNTVRPPSPSSKLHGHQQQQIKDQGNKPHAVGTADDTQAGTRAYNSLQERYLENLGIGPDMLGHHVQQNCLASATRHITWCDTIQIRQDPLAARPVKRQLFVAPSTAQGQRHVSKPVLRKRADNEASVDYDNSSSTTTTITKKGFTKIGRSNQAAFEVSPPNQLEVISLGLRVNDDGDQAWHCDTHMPFILLLTGSCRNSDSI